MSRSVLFRCFFRKSPMKVRWFYRFVGNYFDQKPWVARDTRYYSQCVNKFSSFFFSVLTLILTHFSSSGSEVTHIVIELTVQRLTAIIEFSDRPRYLTYVWSFSFIEMKFLAVSCKNTNDIVNLFVTYQQTRLKSKRCIRSERNN